jgi:hypothetical protein
MLPVYAFVNSFFIFYISSYALDRPRCPMKWSVWAPLKVRGALLRAEPKNNDFFKTTYDDCDYNLLFIENTD